MSDQEPAVSNPEEFYTDAQRKLQAENGHDKLALAVVGAIVRDELEDYHIDYIQSRDYFFLSTVTADGETERPPESKRVQLTAEEALTDLRGLLSVWYDAVLTKDSGNTQVRGTIEVDGASAVVAHLDEADEDRDLIRASIQVQADRLSDISGRLDLILYRLGELQERSSCQPRGGNEP